MSEKKTLIDALLERNIEGEFYTSLIKQYKERGFLTPKQKERLRNTLERYDKFEVDYGAVVNEFTKSLRDQYIRKGQLTDKQITALKKYSNEDDYY